MSWTLITFKQYPIFSRHWIAQAFCIDMKKAVGIGLSKYKSLYSGIYADSDDLNKVRTFLEKKIKNNPTYVKRLCNDWRNACDNLLKYTDKIRSEDFPSYSDKELIRSLENVVKKLRMSAAYVY